MEAEPSQDAPELIAETQEVPVEQMEKLDLKSEEPSETPSKMADPPVTVPEPEKPIDTAAEKPAVTECEEAPPKPSAPEKSPEETPAPKSSEKTPEAQQQKPEEPKLQENSEPEKQEQETVKEVEPIKQEEPVKEEPKLPAVCEAKLDESARSEEAKTGGSKEEVKAPDSDGDQAELPKEAEAEPKLPELPLFFGWLLLPEEEERIKCATMDFLKTLDTLEAFKEHISEFTGQAEKEVDLEQYFQNPMALHCTTKFCDYGKADGAKEYAELQVVKESIEKSEELSVTALFVTSRTFGARVSLTEPQMKLWPEGADQDGVPSALLTSMESLQPGSRAHVTLGCSVGVEAVQTGLDLLEILALQKEGKVGTQVEMEMGTLSYLTEGRWFLALREPITADTKFSRFFDEKPVVEQGKKDGEKKKKKCTIL